MDSITTRLEGMCLPCPFCMEADVRLVILGEDGEDIGVECTQCHAIGPVAKWEGRKSSVCEASAVLLWNKRKK